MCYLLTVANMAYAAQWISTPGSSCSRAPSCTEVARGAGGVDPCIQARARTSISGHRHAFPCIGNCILDTGTLRLTELSTDADMGKLSLETDC
jgi:hypothetical protein